MYSYASPPPPHAVCAVRVRRACAPRFASRFAPRRELRAAGYTAHVLRKVGYVLFELVEGGYTAKELRAAGYDQYALKELGFTAADLRLADFTSRQLQMARYGLREMQQGGFSWKDLGASPIVPLPSCRLCVLPRARQRMARLTAPW